jgi:hypothetical protein
MAALRHEQDGQNPAGISLAGTLFAIFHTPTRAKASVLNLAMRQRRRIQHGEHGGHGEPFRRRCEREPSALHVRNALIRRLFVAANRNCCPSVALPPDFAGIQTRASAPGDFQRHGGFCDAFSELPWDGTRQPYAPYTDENFPEIPCYRPWPIARVARLCRDGRAFLHCRRAAEFSRPCSFPCYQGNGGAASSFVAACGRASAGRTRFRPSC